MPEYAGFANLGAYLKARCRDNKMSLRQLSMDLGFAHTYINGIVEGRFVPQPERADIIADFFGDEKQIVRILAGHELPPRGDSPTLSAIRDVAAGLNEAGQTELLHYANYLRYKCTEVG